MLAMAPVLIFAPVGWFFAEMAGTLAPSPELKLWFYGVGFSLGVFSFGYLCLANWRYHHPRKKHAYHCGQEGRSASGLRYDAFSGHQD